MGACEVPGGTYYVFETKDAVDYFFEEIEDLYYERLYDKTKEKVSEVLKKYNLEEYTDEFVDEFLSIFFDLIERDVEEGYHTYLYYVCIEDPLIIGDEEMDYFMRAIEKEGVLYNVIEDEEKYNKIIKEIKDSLRNVDEETYPSEEEIKKIAMENEGYLGIVSIWCNMGLWGFKIIEDYGVSEFYGVEYEDNEEEEEEEEEEK